LTLRDDKKITKNERERGAMKKKNIHLSKMFIYSFDVNELYLTKKIPLKYLFTLHLTKTK
jgi:hypothetical protein